MISKPLHARISNSSYTFVDCIREVYLASIDSDYKRKAVVHAVCSHKKLVKKKSFKASLEMWVHRSVIAMSKTGF